MNFTDFEWRGFKGLEFEFDGKKALLVKPNVKPNGKFMIKTEYFAAFPELEIEMLNRGYHLSYVANDNRWAEPKDVNRQAEFVKFVSENFGLDKKCLPVGLSCGGLYAVKLAAVCPDRICALYLDAPVMNLLSVVGQFGNARKDPFTQTEYIKATSRSLVELLSYREHPIDKMHICLESDIPIVLVVGDSDADVPYVENGKLLADYYNANGGKITVFIKPNCGHHPHGLENPKELADAIEKYIK